MFKLLISVATLVASVSANCDNACSGHGKCTMDDVCECYDNWGVGLTGQSGDCSDRICPFEIAWVDSPDANGNFHRYAECAGRGLCNRGTGMCECFDGYEGEACHRTTCPNQCSGHGTCEYIEDIGVGRTWKDADISGDDFQVDPKRFNYDPESKAVWDRSKTRGCVCDAQYSDVDCSKRMCPYGTDRLKYKENLDYAAHWSYQVITFKGTDLDTYAGKTFALTFVSRLNETFTTQPIVWDDEIGKGDFANDIRFALLRLPNKVIDDVRVTVTWTSTTQVDVEISFSGDAVQGVQNWLTVVDYECSAGCTPRITGLHGIDIDDSKIDIKSGANYNNYLSFECGRRGKCDYTTGLCQCFDGYTGENCNTLTTLV